MEENIIEENRKLMDWEKSRERKRYEGEKERMKEKKKGEEKVLTTYPIYQLAGKLE